MGATLATLLSSPSLARPSSPPSTVATTTLARDLLTPSLRPLLMLMLPLTLGGPTDTPGTATDSTGHTDTVHTTVDISDTMDMDTEPTDIPTTDKDTAARLFI